MDTTGNLLVIAMGSRLFHIYDIRKMDMPAQERESSLKFLTRALACMVDGQGMCSVVLFQRHSTYSWRAGYATASVEGRIAVEYFDPKPEVQEKKYAFKCHRQTANGEDRVWPVNALAFHPMYVIYYIIPVMPDLYTPSYNTFASAGSDGTVSFWDHKSKKRLKQLSKFHSAVPSVSFNCDGTKLAIGASYNWDEGADGAKRAERPSVYIKDVGSELKVRIYSFDCTLRLPVTQCICCISSRKTGWKDENLLILAYQNMKH